jgi:hypothetical protein
VGEARLGDLEIDAVVASSIAERGSESVHRVCAPAHALHRLSKREPVSGARVQTGCQTRSTASVSIASTGELMWLTGRLMPDFKTIADFRRDSGPAIRAACAQFVVVCRQFNLFTRTIVAIDGSKFKAVNNRDKNFTVAKVAKRIEQVEASIARYLAVLDRADREDGDMAEAKTVRLKEKIEGLRRQMRSLREIGQQVEAAPDE